jgi:Skp family chaperone for outer membrane proteins
MPDEPSNGELGRLIGMLQLRLDSRFSELNTRLDKVVSLDVYTIQTTYVDQRLSQLQADAQQIRSDKNKLEDDFEQYQRDEAKRREDDRQKRLYSAIIPVLATVVSGAIAIWAVVAK